MSLTKVRAIGVGKFPPIDFGALRVLDLALDVAETVALAVDKTRLTGVRGCRVSKSPTTSMGWPYGAGRPARPLGGGRSACMRVRSCQRNLAAAWHCSLGKMKDCSHRAGPRAQHSGERNEILRHILMHGIKDHLTRRDCRPSRHHPMSRSKAVH